MLVPPGVGRRKRRTVPESVNITLQSTMINPSAIQVKLLNGGKEDKALLLVPDEGWPLFFEELSVGTFLVMNTWLSHQRIIKDADNEKLLSICQKRNYCELGANASLIGAGAITIVQLIENIVIDNFCSNCNSIEHKIALHNGLSKRYCAWIYPRCLV